MNWPQGLRPAAGATAVLLTTLGCAATLAQTQRDLSAHEHGAAVLNVAIEGDQATISLEGPAMNFVGFEHAPRDAQQTDAIATALTQLQSPPGPFRLTPAARCELVSATASHELSGEAEDHHEHEEEHDTHAAEAAHSEFTATYAFRCERPERLDSIQVTLFEAFPLTTEIATSLLGPGVQTFAELTPDDPMLSWRADH